MKIVASSNFDEETYNERVVLDNIPTAELAKRICEFINDTFVREYSPTYYVSRKDDYVLRTFEP